MKIFLASDHAGYGLKEALEEYLILMGHDVVDMGNEASDPYDDYPDFIIPAARAVVAHEGSVGIVVGGSGQGEAIAANRIHGVRATVLYTYDENAVRLSREHNNANILSLGARFISEDEAMMAVKLWLETPFSGDERHIRRIAKIDSLTK